MPPIIIITIIYWDITFYNNESLILTTVYDVVQVGGLGKDCPTPALEDPCELEQDSE